MSPVRCRCSATAGRSSSASDPAAADPSAAGASRCDGGEQADERVVSRGGQAGAAADQRCDAFADAIAVAPRERILERGQQPAGPPVRGAQGEPVRGAGARIDEARGPDARFRRAPHARAPDVEHEVAELEVAGAPDDSVADGDRRRLHVAGHSDVGV